VREYVKEGGVHEKRKTFQDSSNTEDPSGYWTKEKMKNAISLRIS